MVTTTMRMVDGVHGHTSGSRPRVPLDLVLVECTTGLEQRLVDTATAGNDTNDTTSIGRDNLLGARGELQPSLALVGIVSDDDGVVTRSPRERTTVTDLLLDVADDCTFGDRAEWEDVSDVERGLLARVDELTSVDSLVGNKSLFAQLELVGVAEDDLGERSTATGVVNDLLDDSTNVSVALGEVESAQLSSTLAQAGVRGEDGSSTLSLITNDATYYMSVFRSILLNHSLQVEQQHLIRTHC